MKKFLLLLAATLVALLSCEKQPDLLPNGEEEDGIVFNLTAKYCEDGPETAAATKAVKTGWESGDVIFVFLNKVAAPKYIRMSYNGTKWTTTLMDGTTVVSSFHLTAAQKSGTMRAVYLPFGNAATVAADATDHTQFNFSKTYYTYYLTGTESYSVSAQNTIDVGFDMNVPENYVQFFVVDPEAADEAFTLATDVAQPVGVTGVKANGQMVLDISRDPGEPMPGYAYGSGAGKGYLFSGVMQAVYNNTYGAKYYLALTKQSPRSRKDLFVTPSATIKSHNSIRLPQWTDDRWQAVGSSVSVAMVNNKVTYGTWATCNVGTEAPEEIPQFNYTAAKAYETSTMKFPTKAQFTSLIGQFTWTWIKVGGKMGYVIQGDLGTGFLFLPVTDSDLNPTRYYWGFDTTAPYCLQVSTNKQTAYIDNPDITTPSHPARLVQ